MANVLVRVHLILVVMVLPSIVFAESGNGAELELICPCTLESGGDNAATARFGVINRGSDATGELIFRVYAHTEPSFRESRAAGTQEYMGDIEVTSSLAGSSQVAVTDFESSSISPPSGQFYVSFLLLNDLTIHDETRSGEVINFNNATYSVASADFLVDSDGDGVADDNESFMGTNPNSAASAPGKSTIDVLAVFNPETDAQYSGDVEARIDHLFAVSNQALADSGVNMEIRVAGYEEIGFDDSLGLEALLTQSGNGSGVFANLAATRDARGADLVAIVRGDDGGDLCGLATLGGYPTQGLLGRTEYISTTILDFNFCGDLTMIHEIGHNLGLGHSFRQNEVGTFIWARGYGVDNQFATLMAYASEFSGISTELPYFSNPAVNACNGNPCGVDVNSAEPANAALTLDIIRFQAAAFSGEVDSDSDGVSDPSDAFPNDPTETLDTDGDGIGNNADTDDDADGIPDTFENANGLNPLVDDASEDPDGDGLTNLEEFEGDTDPQIANESNACTDPDAVAPIAADSSLSFEKRVVIANPGSNVNKQSFIRFLNPNSGATSVEIYGVDDAGVLSKQGPVTFTIPENGAVQITAQDLEGGNADKGISSSLCDLAGKWQLIVRSDQAIDIMSMIRTTNGFLTGVNDVVPSTGGVHEIYFGNPASNISKVTFLRIANKDDVSGTVSISGFDDNGDPSGTITFSLAANASKQMTATDLENGNAGKGLAGSLGNGAGKWRLSVSSSLDLGVQSLIRTSDGFLTNLSGVAPASSTNTREVYFVNPATETFQSTFLRIVNTSGSDNQVTLSAIDDNGDDAPGGDITLTVPGNASIQLTAADLENGNSNKGLSGSFGDGDGRWRLTVSGTSSLEVMSLIRTPDGFLTNLSRIAPRVGNETQVLMINPGSNVNKASTLRIVNQDNVTATVSIVGYDDTGSESVSAVQLTIAAGASVDLSAQDLENGGGGLTGSLGDGSGKWRLEVDSAQDIVVQSLLNTSDGFLTNLSRGVE